MFAWSESVDRFARLEHRNELRQTPCPRLRPFGVLKPEEDGVAVLAAQLGEERACLGAKVELALEIVGYNAATLSLVRGFPSAVGLRPLNLGQTGGAHPPLPDQTFCFLAVDP